MKKILLSIVISGASACAFAQPTFDCESWTGTEPTGWISANELSILGNPQSVFKETTKIHGGTAAMKIVTVTLTSNPSSTTIPNPMGVAMIGVVSMTPTLNLKLGYGNTTRPGVVSFWYEYTPVVSGDTASIVIWQTKWNGATRDTIATGVATITSAVVNYTQLQVPLIAKAAFLNTTPDTMGIVISATTARCLTCGRAGSILYVDDITFSGSTGISEPSSFNDVELFPNPGNQFINISVGTEDAVSAIVFDAVGKMVASAPLNISANGMKKAGVINTSNLATGLYSYSVLDKNGKPMRSGKFNVAR